MSMLLEESILLGLLGAVVFVLTEFRQYGIVYWKDRKVQIVCHIILGPISGYLVFVMVTYYGWANHLTSFLAGFSAPAFIEGIVRRAPTNES